MRAMFVSNATGRRIDQNVWESEIDGPVDGVVEIDLDDLEDELREHGFIRFNMDDWNEALDIIANVFDESDNYCAPEKIQERFLRKHGRLT